MAGEVTEADQNNKIWSPVQDSNDNIFSNRSQVRFPKILSKGCQASTGYTDLSIVRYLRNHPFGTYDMYFLVILRDFGRVNSSKF